MITFGGHGSVQSDVERLAVDYRKGRDGTPFMGGGANLLQW